MQECGQEVKKDGSSNQTHSMSSRPSQGQARDLSAGVSLYKPHQCVENEVVAKVAAPKSHRGAEHEQPIPRVACLHKTQDPFQPLSPALLAPPICAYLTAPLRTSSMLTARCQRPQSRPKHTYLGMRLGRVPLHTPFTSQGRGMNKRWRACVEG